MKTKSYFRKSGLIFKQWMHKSYAVYNTLHREIKIGFLSMVYFTCLGCHLTLAGNTTDSINTKIRLDEVEISARRGPSVYSEIGRPVTVLSRARIETLPVQSVQDLLRYVIGVDIRERGPLGVQADISMRGGNFDQVMILLNGVNITDPQTGHHALNLPVDLASIDRVEILRGPAARVYGPNAFSGAINFITGTFETDKVTISGMAGEYGLYSAGVAITHNSGPFRNYISAGKGASEGYISNTDFEMFNLFYHGRLQLNNDQLSFQSGYSEKAFGANSFYSADYPDQFENTKTFFNALTFESGGTIKIKPNIYWRRHYDRFELFRDGVGAEPWYTGHNYHLTDVFGAGMNVSIPWSLGTTSVGGEMRGESVWSNVLGYDLDSVAFLKVPGEEDRYYTRQFHRNNASLFFEHTYTKNRLSLSAGVLLNRNSQLGYGIDWFPGFDISYWLNENLKWMASYNQSLRLPTFTDMFYQGPANVGNIHAAPEESYTIETGIRMKKNWYDIQAGGFYRQGQDLIDWGRMSGESRFTIYNIEQVDTYGLELMSLFLFPELFNPEFMVRNLNISYSYLWQDEKISEGYESRYVLVPLRHKLNIGIEHGIIINGFYLNWNVQYQDRDGEYYHSARDELVAYSSIWVADARLTWRQNSYRIYTEASNLLDQRYADLGELIKPGRWIRFGFVLDLEY